MITSMDKEKEIELLNTIIQLQTENKELKKELDSLKNKFNEDSIKIKSLNERLLSVLDSNVI